MHELAAVRGLVDMVLRRTGDQRVTAVRVEVGRLSGVSPEAVALCFEAATAGTPLDGAALQIEERAGRARCRVCGEDFELTDLFAPCRCGSTEIEVTAGRDLLVTTVDVE